MKFQNPSIHGSKVMLCITKHAMYKCPNLQRAITLEKYVLAIVFIRNPYMKFQNPSIYGSKVMLCITKHAMYKCPNL